MTEEIKDGPNPAPSGAAEKPKDPVSREAGSLEPLLTRLEETLSRVEASALPDAERQKLESTRALAEITRERDRLGSESKGWEQRYKESLVRQLLTEAATSCGAYRADQVVALLRGQISWSEDGREPILTLSGPDGQPAVFSRERFRDGVRAFLADNPNLAASAAGGGAGSRSSSTPAAAVNSSSMADLKKQRKQLEEQARQFKGSKFNIESSSFTLKKNE